MKLAMLLLSLLVMRSASAVEVPAFRSEYRVLSHLLCNSDSPPAPAELWNRGLYDAQINASWLQSDSELDDAQLKELARGEALKQQHSGYAYGTCGKGRAWVLTTHAIGPILSIGTSEIIVHTDRIRAFCKTFDMDFAAWDGGMPRTLAKAQVPSNQGFSINPSFLKAGTLSVTCHPYASKQGPQLWTLAPVHVEAESFLFGMSAKAFDLETLAAWLQERRHDLGLPPLNIKPELQKLAEELSQHKSIKHPHAFLKEKRKALKKKKISLIGENRAAAQSPSELAWLLWNSPQHRRLLLHPKANSLGLSLRRQGNEKLLVMVLGRI